MIEQINVARKMVSDLISYQEMVDDALNSIPASEYKNYLINKRQASRKHFCDKILPCFKQMEKACQGKNIPSVANKGMAVMNAEKIMKEVSGAIHEENSILKDPLLTTAVENNKNNPNPVVLAIGAFLLLGMF